MRGHYRDYIMPRCEHNSALEQNAARQVSILVANFSNVIDNIYPSKIPTESHLTAQKSELILKLIVEHPTDLDLVICILWLCVISF